MRIKAGYGRKAIEANIQEFIRCGDAEDDAKRIALNLARKHFRKVNPDKPLPDYLEVSNDRI